MYILVDTSPHRLLAVPCWGERGLRPQAQVPPNTPGSNAFSKAWLLARRAWRDAGWAGHVPRGYVPLAGRAGAPCGNQTTAGPTGPMPGQARIMTYMRKRERKRRVKVPVKPAAPNRGRGRVRLHSRHRAENRRG